MTADGEPQGATQAPWLFGFGPRNAEFAWRCQRCLTVMRKSRRCCPTCAYTVYDPVHRKTDDGKQA